MATVCVHFRCRILFCVFVAMASATGTAGFGKGRNDATRSSLGAGRDEVSCTFSWDLEQGEAVLQGVWNSLVSWGFGW